MDGIRAWGLRIVAGVLVVSGVLALAAAASTNEVHLRLRAGRGAIRLLGMSAVGVSLFMIGCGGFVLLTSLPEPQRPAWLRYAATALLIAGGVLAGIHYVLTATA